ncbi:response regulator [Vibrio sp. SCSIO 43136]|uniref:ATP-binding response regulator n=1 Tax=Vibrio sp. SCSIO 43136 TaxID=2819101 RepID=UPI0020755422|nr:response regulator [Vibrio sp. SCSIO 43136]
MLSRAKKIYEYAEPNLTIVALMGIFGYPLYYLIWQMLTPSGYENLPLRLCCAVLLLPILLRKQMPVFFKGLQHVYYIVSLGVCIPFFFSFMMLMNEWSIVWVMSLMSGIFLQILLIYDTRIVFLQSIAAYSASYFAAYFFGEADLSLTLDWTYLPILAFTYIFGTLFHYRNQAEHESKVSLAKSFGAGIAHEMRNPLSAVYSSLEVVKHLLPERNSQHLSDTYQIDATQLDQINVILEDSLSVIEKGNETISLLLTSIDEHKLSTGTFKRYRLGESLELAINSFHYVGKADRAMIHLEYHHDDDFFGSEVLLRYVIFNLLKNAYYYKMNPDFTINVTLSIEDDRNVISVIDTGPGMDEDTVKQVFDDFYTTGKKGGFGLGLPFCRKVMRAFNGDIECESHIGVGTSFHLVFPKYNSEAVFDIKQSLIKDKQIAYIGHKNSTLSALQSHAFFSGYQLESIEDLARVNEYEFKQDVLLIDLSIYTDKPTQFSALERLLCNFEGKIVYLYSGNILDCFKLNRILPYELMEINTFGQTLAVKLDKLLFEESTAVSRATTKPIPQGNVLPTVLIVDDNASLRIYSSTLLERQGYRVLQAENGKTALQLLKSNPVSIILMDLEMPEMDGIQTTKAIRERQYSYEGKEIPIICFTGEKCEDTLKAIAESGMNDYILKPASKDVLINKVSTWV